MAVVLLIGLLHTFMIPNVKTMAILNVSDLSVLWFWGLLLLVPSMDIYGHAIYMEKSILLLDLRKAFDLVDTAFPTETISISM